MHWYGGSIAEAVNLSKQKNAIFVVFVEGDNELSVEMAATIDDSVVLSRLSDEANFLAIKLKSGSANYIHFAQIYQFVPVPSLFFIGRNGTPLEVVCAGVQSSNLATRIDRILEEHFKDKQPSMSSTPTLQASTSSTNIQPPVQPTALNQNVQQTVSFVQTEAAAMLHQTAPPAAAEPESASGSPPPKMPKTDSAETKTLTPEDMICDGDVCVRRPTKADEPGPSQAPTPSLPNTPANPEDTLLHGTESGGSVEEKMERAKELIEARRREKADKEKELEKEKEIERRQAGKGVAELKRWQADQELKQIQEERRREKMENNLARQRILEQIAQDRAERRARDQPQSNQPQPTVQPTPSDGGGRARIQFKLPDGTSHTAHFDADGTLREVQRYVTDNLRLSSSNFSLWTAFPRRELNEQDATLRGLQLAPSAALLVLPRRTAAVVARPSAVSSLISRTFGRPFKKMMAALIPVIFQIGAASTWAVIAALVGVKTLIVTLVILKILLVAGAAKVGALFAHKTHGSSHGGWEPPHQKEIHLHIHNGGHPEVHDEHGAISTWNRDGTAAASASDNKNINLVINPYAAAAGPQTISTPYGNYVRVDNTPNALS